MKFLDARIQLGRSCMPHEGAPNTTEEILEVMQRCDIERAIASHAIAKESNMQAGNEALLALTGEGTPFLRQWYAMPSALGEFFSPEELFRQMKQHDVTSLRLMPKKCGHPIRPYVLGKLMAAAADCHVPVFMNLHEDIAPDELYDLCKYYPDVDLVICRVDYRQNRVIGPVLEQCPNLYIGTSIYVVHSGLKLLSDHGYTDRLIFESGLPNGSATAAVSLIRYAEISEEEKELIAHGNMERLLSNVRL
ncbi:MAG: amidohydrolase family protein [Oscillospiraceae bacterium]|nr:amidohydrolase family protein [Oscillospiraceae bacterium]